MNFSVPLTFEKDGVTYRKIFVLKRDSYDVGVNFEIVNQSGSAIEVEPYGQLKHTLVESSGNVAMPTYTGGAYSSSETNYKKYSFSDMKDKKSFYRYQSRLGCCFTTLFRISLDPKSRCK